jgi:hypothetical protein
LVPSELGAVVVPFGAAAGAGAIAATLLQVPIIQVAENRTIVPSDATASWCVTPVFVRSFLEATGVIVAAREGLLPAVRRLGEPISSDE